MAAINLLELAGLGLFGVGLTLLVVVWGFFGILGWVWTLWFSLEGLLLVAAGAAVTLGYHTTAIGLLMAQVRTFAEIDPGLTLQPQQALLASLVLLALALWHLLLVTTAPARGGRGR